MKIIKLKFTKQVLPKFQYINSALTASYFFFRCFNFIYLFFSARFVCSKKTEVIKNIQESYWPIRWIYLIESFRWAWLNNIFTLRINFDSKVYRFQHLHSCRTGWNVFCFLSIYVYFEFKWNLSLSHLQKCKTHKNR